MTIILNHIRSLEYYIERIGARLVRTTLPGCVQGRVFSNFIVLRAGLNPEQELLTLVHELTHWLAHRDAGPEVHFACCTIFEYEAEAVEALVMARLGLPCKGQGPADLHQDNPTDDLLAASVARVIWASSRICGALGLEPEWWASELRRFSGTAAVFQS